MMKALDTLVIWLLFWPVTWPFFAIPALVIWICLNGGTL